MNKAEKLYRQFIKDWAPIHHKALTKSEYNDLVILFESHLNAMRDEYAQQISKNRDVEWMKHLIKWGDKSAKTCPVLPNQQK